MSISNLKAKGIAVVTAITLLTTVGCSNKKTHVLEGTLLDNAVVASTDNGVGLYRCYASTNNLPPHFDKKGPVHFFDLVSGERITAEKACSDNNVRKVNDIILLDNILNYLTEEELEKAINNELTALDSVAIIQRINESEKEKAQQRTITP